MILYCYLVPYSIRTVLFSTQYMNIVLSSMIQYLEDVDVKVEETPMEQIEDVDDLVINISN